MPGQPGGKGEQRLARVLKIKNTLFWVLFPIPCTHASLGFLFYLFKICTPAFPYPVGAVQGSSYTPPGWGDGAPIDASDTPGESLGQMQWRFVL